MLITVSPKFAIIMSDPCLPKKTVSLISVIDCKNVRLHIQALKRANISNYYCRFLLHLALLSKNTKKEIIKEMYIT